MKIINLQTGRLATISSEFPEESLIQIGDVGILFRPKKRSLCPWAFGRFKSENNSNRREDHYESDPVVPPQGFPQKPCGKHSEHNKGDHFLDNFELRRGEKLVADAIGWNHEAIFYKSNSPTRKYCVNDRGFLVVEMAVPGIGHEGIGDQK
jgi:hypothetical protein